MNIKALFIAAICGILTFTGCSKPAPATGQTEEKTNFFLYDGYSFDINSAARVDKGDNTIEIWLSPDKGLTSMEGFLESGDFLTICTHSSYLGNRDRFSGQASKNSFIRFADKEFRYGQEGTAYIEAEIDGEGILKLDFVSERMYTRSQTAAVAAMMSGKYEGPVTTFQDTPYSNEWGLDSNRSSVQEVRFIEQEDKSSVSIAIADRDYNEALNITFTPDNIGKTLNFSTESRPKGVKLSYFGGVGYELSKALGTIRTEIKDNLISINIDLTSNNLRVRAVYTGNYTYRLAKQNRFIYESGTSSSQYNGRHEILKLMVKDAGDNTIFYLSPNEYYTTQFDYTHMPILEVPDDVVNRGRTYMTEITDWDFKFDLMQVAPYEDDAKPYPADNDWVEINYMNGIYEINLELTGNAEGLPASSIDLYYKGKSEN